MSIEQHKKDEELDQDIADIKTQLDITTKYVMGNGDEKENAVRLKGKVRYRV